MNIYGYAGTPQELAISIARQSDETISNLLDLLSDEIYKKACKLSEDNLFEVVNCLDKASKLIGKTKLEIVK